MPGKPAKTDSSVARRVQANRRLVRDGAATEDVDRAKARLDGVLAAYPGLAAGSCFDADGDGFTVTCVYGPGDLGRAAALAVDFIAARVGASSESGPDATRVRCSPTEFVRFQHYLYYGSELQVAARPVARLSRTPLPTLLGGALGTFTCDYDRARVEEGDVPQLPAWANVLRVIDPEGTDQQDIVRRAVVAKRIARIAVQRLERRGQLVVEARAVPGRRGKARTVLLTDQGAAARARAEALVETLQHDWRQRFGDGAIDRLRDALAGVVDRLPIELPHHVTGYGEGDPSVTGGDYHAEQPGPPRIPAHGQEWPVVLREPGSDARALPLPALLSQVLAAFAIDYDRERLGGLNRTSNFLRFVGDDGMALEQAQTLGRVSGNGKTLHERHLDVVVEPGRPRDMTRRVYPTPKSRRARDAYPHLVTEIEEGWAGTYGEGVAALRAVLETMSNQFDADLPDYPDTNGWIHRLWHD
ncbi:MAG: hypothetical protein OXG82_02790 [Gammaproteobacteria bacterium]|nr:hypothetical protein [Gammaproteobacteria bacterium]